MKKILFIGFAIILGLSSCDKVENPYPFVPSTQLDYTLFPGGDSISYAATEWPTFVQNTNSARNVLIEDFTGHQCIYCPPAADTAHLLHLLNPGRVYAASIHSGPNGIEAFQATDATFPIDWTNPEGLAIGMHFGAMPGTAFISNPKGNVSRILNGGQHFSSPSQWRTDVNTALPATLKVNIQSAANFYPSTSGIFLHSEIEVLDGGLTMDDLYTVVYLMEDSLVAKQKMPDNSTNASYIHRDIMRGCISSNWRGRKISEGTLTNGKYYLNYSYALPAQYNPGNVHLLIYVRDNITEEIYHVIEQKIL